MFEATGSPTSAAGGRGVDCVRMRAIGGIRKGTLVVLTVERVPTIDPTDGPGAPEKQLSGKQTNELGKDRRSSGRPNRIEPVGN